MKYLAVLGRQPEISLAELESLFSNVKKIAPSLATFEVEKNLNFSRLGGSLKIAETLPGKPLDFLKKLPDGKITFGLSDYSPAANQKSVKSEALKLKQILVRHGRSVRVIDNKTAILSSATSLHNGLTGKNSRKVELIKFKDSYFKVVHVQNIDAYARRDQNRPARDARVGMLPPKLAQVLINLCGDLPADSRILDPFCGTGVVLQEALLMNYRAYGTDLNERMIEYSKKNLEWLENQNFYSVGMRESEEKIFWLSTGDATSFQWPEKVDAVACEGYLGRPMSQIPPEIKLKTEKQECSAIILGFLKNLASQIKPDTPVVIAAPAWLRNDGTYSRLNLIDEIRDMGYNVNNKTREGLLYHREDQIVARDIIILRKN